MNLNKKSHIKRTFSWLFPFRIERSGPEITFVINGLQLETVKSGEFTPFDKCDKETCLEDVSKSINMK